MSRIKREDKIINLAKKQNVTHTSMTLFAQMIYDSENGIIKNYSQEERRYKRDLFNNDDLKYYEAFVELQKIKKLIMIDNTSDLVYIKPYSDRYYNNLVIELKNRRRSYVKDPDADKQSLFKILSEGKYGRLLSEPYLKNDNSKEINYKVKANGFKIPDTFRPYLTGEPIPEKDIKIYKIYQNSNFIPVEEQRRNLTKEEKRTLCACIAFADSNGIIEDYNIHTLVKCIQREFGDNSFNTSTMYLAISRLLELKFFDVYTNNAGIKCLKILQYKESFENKRHYIIIPNIVLDKAFKQLQASAIKLFFYFIFLLNNGEDSDNKYIGQNKAIYFKIAKLSYQTQESKNTFEFQQLWLKKRYPGELKTLLLGKIDDDDYSSLSKFFHFYATGDTVLQVRIRKEYFVSKKAEKLKQLILLKSRDKKRANLIESTLDNKKIAYTPEDLISLIRIFKGVSEKVIRAILGQLADRIKNGKEKGWREVESIPALTRTYYSIYQGEENNSDFILE